MHVGMAGAERIHAASIRMRCGGLAGGSRIHDTFLDGMQKKKKICHQEPKKTTDQQSHTRLNLGLKQKLLTRTSRVPKVLEETNLGLKQNGSTPNYIDQQRKQLRTYAVQCLAVNMNASIKQVKGLLATRIHSTEENSVGIMNDMP